MRLLLAEDEVELSNAIAAALKHNNYSVDVVYNGEDALSYLESENYDGALIDIMMPVLDGLSVIKKLRERGNGVPVLILTAKSDIDDRVLGLDCGADDYLTKPFATKELLARIRAMTRRKSSEVTSSVLTAFNISLDRTTFELSGPESVIRLAGKEFQMMEMMLMSIGTPISVEKFMEKIWGYDSEAEINVVWVYISNLRKKLAAIGGNAKIKAVRNIGYIIEEKN